MATAQTTAKQPATRKTANKSKGNGHQQLKKTEAIRPSIEGPERFYNRELSWLQFNRRVLEEARNMDYPLLERLRFLSISASNLDEFYMVRVAGLYGQIMAEVSEMSADGQTPAQQLKAINAFAAMLVEEKSQLWADIKLELAAAGIHVVEADDLTQEERDLLRTKFSEEIFPVLTPLNVDPAQPFPFIQNKSLNISVDMRNDNGKSMTGLIPIPPQLERFFRLPARQSNSEEIRFVKIETIVSLFIEELFPSFEILDSGMFRVLRDSGIEFQEKAEDLTKAYEALLRRRRHGNVIRLEINGTMTKRMCQFVIKNLKVKEEVVFVKDGMIGLADVAKLIVDERRDLMFSPFDPRFPERVDEMGGNVFAAIERKDFIVHHPYESFDIVLRYLRQAITDPDVLAIKWTLYRTSKVDSPIVEYLKEAAELGKSVTAVVELKARFDENANINVARELEKSGVHVVYGFQQLKTHAKLGIVVRRQNNKITTYCHIGTGNYHPQTARIYTDLSYFTDDPIIARDVAKIFNYITGYGKPASLDKIAASPHGIRERIVEHIDQEIAHAKAGRPASIWCKMNALVDPDIIDKFYQASGAGVQINLVVRGICCLRPGIEGLSENIRVKSIVGRFLEHSRIYCFGQGEPMPSRHAAVYISSADLMERNLNRRVEAMVPIVNETVHEQVLDQVMGVNIRDNRQSWRILSDGSHERLTPAEGETIFNAHEYFMTNPSLSGRGQALQQKKPPILDKS